MATTPGVPDGNWLRGAATDERGLWDAAYISVLALAGLVVLTVVVEIALVAAAWWLGKPYDPRPLGTAMGYICGGFATAIGGLAGYMWGSRPHRDGDGGTTGDATN